MKKTNIEVIERNSISTEPTFSLLPNLLDKNELSKIAGGVVCGGGYELRACYFYTGCESCYGEGDLRCSGYTSTERCTSA